MATYHGPNGERDPMDEFSFEWNDRDDELSPETEELLKELSVPIGRVPVRQLAEVVHTDLLDEVRNRMEDLRVDGYDRVDKRWIKAAPELQMTPYILDDVHYAVYRARKNRGPYNRFVSVTADEILDAFVKMRESGANGIVFQREQDDQAKKTLIKNHIEENSIYEAMATPDGRFAVRSLYRLLREDSMRPFTNTMARATRRRMDEAPLSFEEVAIHAPRFIGNKLSRHLTQNPTYLSSDQRLTHELISRDLQRARAFAMPVTEYMAKTVPAETEQ